MVKKKKVAILGATGFTGEMLVELLLKHPFVEITYLSSRTPKPVPYSTLFPRFQDKTTLMCEGLDISRAREKADIFFLALPHCVSMDVVPVLFDAGKKVIDLSADYRLRDPKVYERFYNKAHEDTTHLSAAVYGLPEFFKASIAKAKLVANPGCYPTAIILALAPLLKENVIADACIVDAKSSISGAGRKAVIEHHYMNISNNLWAYKPFVHQHLSEITQALEDISGKKPNITFVPHVVGVENGIYATLYAGLKKKISKEELKTIYGKYYSSSPFVRLCPELPRLKYVVGTNFCDIGVSVNEDGSQAVVASCIDNLIKGAAGTAVQNMNIMEGFEETQALCL